MKKKNDLLKAIGILFLVYVVLSWIIPTGSFSSGSFVKGTTSPLGIFDVLRYPIVALTSSVFVLNALIILFIGGLYGVLNKTEAYGAFVSSLAKRLKGKEKRFLVISILVFSILTSLTALTLPMFVLVPFFVAVILLLGYGKITALFSTVGAILVGNMASTYGFNINGYVSYFFGTNINKMIGYRLGFFVLVVGLLIFVTLKSAKLEKNVSAKKKGKKEKEETIVSETKEIPFLELHEKTKKSIVPMITIVGFVLVLALVGMYNWANVNTKFTFFNNIHEAITDFTIGKTAIFKNLLGSIDPLGFWTNYELAILLVLASLLIGWIYNVKFKTVVEAFVEGMKKMLPVAVYTMIASIIFLLMNSNSNGGTYFNTIANGILGFTKTYDLGNVANVSINGLIAFVGGLFFNDFPYLINALTSQLTTLYKNTTLIGLIYQSIHGLVMLVAPTSIILVAGLKYLNISYTEWLKNIWKYVVMAFVAILFILIMAMLLV